MEWEINKLIASEYKPLKELGWLLYDAGSKTSELSLNKDDIHKLLTIFNDDSLQKIEEYGYNEGLNEAGEY